MNAARFGPTRIAMSADLRLPLEIVDGAPGVSPWEHGAITFDHPNYRIWLDNGV